MAVALSKQIEDVLATNDASQAMDLIGAINADLLQSQGEETADDLVLKRLQAKLSFVALRYISVPRLLNLIDQHMADVLDLPDNVDLVGQLKMRLVEEFSLEDRNKLRDQMLQALRQSSSRFGDAPLVLGNEEVRPTIENWLKLYFAFGESGEAKSVKTARFLARDPNVQKLSAEQKEQLKKLLTVHQFLTQRSEWLSGFETGLTVEDESGNLVVIDDGNIEPVYDEQTVKEYQQRAQKGELDADTLATMLLRFPDKFSSSLPAPKVKSATIAPDQIQQRTQNFFAQQAQTYAKLMHVSGVPLPNRTAALVAMMHKAISRGQEADLILSREILQNVVADQDKFINFMRHTSIITMLQSEFPSALGEKNKEVLKQSPASPMALQALLMIVFGKFKLSQEEVAWHAFEVLQKIPINAKEFKTIVTYDVSQDKLVWRY